MTIQGRAPITFDRWLVVIIDQVESRKKTNPQQPTDETKTNRRFIVLSQKDKRPYFNCIECVSKKMSVNYPDVEIPAMKGLFSVDSIARVGMIYTLSKLLEGIAVKGVLADRVIQNQIAAGVRFYLP